MIGVIAAAPQYPGNNSPVPYPLEKDRGAFVDFGELDPFPSPWAMHRLARTSRIQQYNVVVSMRVWLRWDVTFGLLSYFILSASLRGSSRKWPLWAAVAKGDVQ